MITGDSFNLEQLVDLQGKCSYAQKKAISHELSKRITLYLENSNIFKWCNIIKWRNVFYGNSTK